MKNRLIFILPSQRFKNSLIKHISKITGIKLTSVSEYLAKYNQTHVPIIYGFLNENGLLIKKLLAENSDFLYIDNPWVRESNFTPTFTDKIKIRLSIYPQFSDKSLSKLVLRVTRNSLFHYSPSIKEMPYISRKNIELNTQGHILIIPPSLPMEELLNCSTWVTSMIDIVRSVTYQKVIIRYKPSDNRIYNFIEKYELPGQRRDSAGDVYDTLSNNSSGLLLSGEIDNCYISNNRALKEDLTECRLAIVFNSSVLLDCIRQNIPVLIGNYHPLSKHFPIDSFKQKGVGYTFTDSGAWLSEYLSLQEYSYMQLKSYAFWESLIQKEI